MSVCVVVLKKNEAANELLLSLRNCSTPFITKKLVHPKLSKTSDSGDFSWEDASQENCSDKAFKPVNIDSVKLLTPKLGRQERQKSMALWLMPFGFIAGMVFAKMTGLQTFASLGIKGLSESFLGGLVGMLSGLIGSFVASVSVNSDQTGDLRSLRKRNEEGFWLLLLETPFEVELPWNLLKKANPIELVLLENS